MGNLRVSNEVVLAKVETTYGVDAAPTAGSNAVMVMNVAFDNKPLRMVQRPAIRGFLAELQRVFAGQLGKIKFDVEIKGSGAAGTAPELDPLLRACGLSQTINAGVSVVYQPRSSGFESTTVYWYEGGRKQHKLTGCVGNMKLKCDTGGLPVLSFELTGHVANPTDQTQPVPTFNTHVPAPAINISAFALGAISAINVRKLELDLGWKVITPPALAAADGYGNIQLVSRFPNGVLEMDAELASVIDLDSQLSSGAVWTLTAGTFGAVAGNKWALTSAASGMYWTDRNFAESEGLRVRSMPFGLVESTAGNDDVTLTFT